jgi:hypothetical protein
MEFTMKTNENSLDRILRIGAALIIGALIALKVITGTIALVLGIVAVVLVVTGLAGFCAIYALLGLSTCRIKS